MREAGEVVGLRVLAGRPLAFGLCGVVCLFGGCCACTVNIDPPVDVHINCIEVPVFGGVTELVCPDAGVDAGAKG